jgi:hypothetical protein
LDAHYRAVNVFLDKIELVYGRVERDSRNHRIRPFQWLDDDIIALFADIFNLLQQSFRKIQSMPKSPMHRMRLLDCLINARTA